MRNERTLVEQLEARAEQADCLRDEKAEAEAELTLTQITARTLVLNAITAAVTQVQAHGAKRLQAAEWRKAQKLITRQEVFKMREEYLDLLKEINRLRDKLLKGETQ
jgi:hypothetical protein